MAITVVAVSAGLLWSDGENDGLPDLDLREVRF
jgi:hypothetical protein